MQLYHNDETGVVQNCVCDAECPNKEGHISESSISVTNSETRNIPVIRCRECKAEFDAYTGGPLNDNAKGYPAELAEEYLAGAVLLGAAPCTAMVFVWSYLTKGNAAYTLVQVAVNDLILLVAFVPVVALLLGVGGIAIPWDTLILSVVLFVVIPLVAGIITRITVTKRKGIDYFNNVFVKKFNNTTIGGLLLTLVILFSFQGETILNNPLHIVLIAVPLILQTILIFFVAYGWAKWWKLPHDIAAPAR